MQVKEFRFLSTKDKHKKLWGNWSRAYEYEWVLSNIEKDCSTIHNTACGFAPIHKKFADKLDKHGITFNSDYDIPKNPIIKGVFKYDLRQETEAIYDIVICVSTLEHLKEEEIKNAFLNLYKQANKQLILTFDYPRVKLEMFEDLLGVKCTDVEDRLSGINSAIVNEVYHGLNIIVLNILK